MSSVKVLRDLLIVFVVKVGKDRIVRTVFVLKINAIQRMEFVYRLEEGTLVIVSTVIPVFFVISCLD